MGNIVSFHTGCNFDGQSSGSLKEGDYDIGQMVVPNDSIQSIKITPGYKVTVYEHAGFQGASHVITSDFRFCGWTAINFSNGTPVSKNISSFKIRKTNSFENVDQPSTNSDYYLLILAIVLLIAFLNRESLIKFIKR